MKFFLLYCVTVCLCIYHVLGAKLGDTKSLSKRAGLTRLIYYNDTDSNVRITTPVPQLTEVTFCLWMRSTSTNDDTMVSYAVPDNYNEMILFGSKNIGFLINAVHITTNVDAVNDGVCHYICFTWTSVTGRWQIFVDGVLVDSGTVSKGTPIQGGGVLVLGQEQDFVGGGFDPFQAFVGKMTNFNLWNRVLTNQEIIEKLDNGNIYSWDISNLLMQGTETIRNEDICTGAVTCDPHFTTLDGRHYSHQGVCWYTLVKDSSNSKPEFEITAKFEPRKDHPNGEIRTRVVALNITVGDDHAEVDRLDVVSGKTCKALSKIHIIQSDENVLLSFTLKDTTFKIDWTLRRHIFSIDISGLDYQDKLCGLLGNYNGDSHDDFQKPDGTMANDAVEFGESWKVPGIECE